MDTLDAPAWRAKLCRGLERLASAVRLLRLAPQDEAPKRQAFAEVLDDLRPALERAPWLVLAVHPHTLVLGEEVVYEQINRAESLAFRLFREGVGRLALRQDVDAERLARLADLLAVPQDVNEALGVDLMIHLWAQPLAGVSLSERPWHALRLLEPHTRDPHILKASVADALVFFQPSGGALRELAPSLCGAAEIAARWRALSPSLKTPTLPPTPAPSRDLRDTLQGLAGLAQDALRASPGAPPAHLDEFYPALLRALVLFHERAIFEAQVQHLEHLSYASGERGVFVADLLARASSPAALQRILPHLEGEAVSEDRWVCDFFVRHTRHAGAEFHPLFSVARSGRAFSLLAELVWRLSPAQPDAWLSLIERTSAESALALLTFLQGRADAALMEPIYRHASGHPDASLRHTTISAIPLRDSAGRVQPVLLDALRDPSAHVRIAAIQRLANSGEPALGIFLVEHLQHPSFLRAQPEEQQALLRGLLQLGQDRHTPVLLQQLDQWERGLARHDASSGSLANLKRACEQVLWALSQHRTEASFQRLYERAALAPDDLFHAYQRALESFAEHGPHRPRTPAPAVSGRTTFLEQPSLALSFQDDPEPSLVLTPTRSMKPQNIDALLHAYLQDDAAMMDLLPQEPLPVDDSPSVPPTPPRAIEEMLREYLGVPQDEQGSHELPVPPLSDVPQRPVRAKGKLTPPPDLLLHELLDASPSPNFLDASPPEGAWGADSAPTLFPGRAKRYARAPEDSDLPDFGLGFGAGGDDLSADHIKWLDEFADPELDDEVSSLIDDLMDEPPPKKKTP